MKIKICKNCGIEKNIEDFRKYRNKCKQCEKLEKKEYYLKTKEYKLEYSKNYNKLHSQYYKEYRKNHKDKMKRYNKDYYNKNKNKLINYSIKYEKERSSNDLLYKTKKQIRGMIYNSFYRFNYNKNDKIENIIGIKVKDFIKYLLQTYKNNYGVEWNGIEKVHIDHIKPLKECKNEEEVIKYCHYTNLQLLKARDNLQKGCKLNWELSK